MKGLLSDRELEYSFFFDRSSRHHLPLLSPMGKRLTSQIKGGEEMGGWGMGGEEGEGGERWGKEGGG